MGKGRPGQRGRGGTVALETNDCQGAPGPPAVSRADRPAPNHPVKM